MKTNHRQAYSTDVTDVQWLIIEAFLLKVLTKSTKRGRPMSLDLREIVNAIRYLLRNGCTWRDLPHDFLAYQSVRYHFDKWCKSGLWKALNKHLRRKLREQEGKLADCSVGIADSQSVKGSVHEENGYDGGKKVNGRKRHILVDTMGLLIVVLVTTANRSDKKGLEQMLKAIKSTMPRLKVIKADQGYVSARLEKWVLDICGWILEVTKKPEGKGFQVIPQRWVVERTFAWLGNYRRLSKDYEVLAATSEAFIYMAMCDIMTKRLAHQSTPNFA